MEMIARQVDLVDGKYVPANAIAPWTFARRLSGAVDCRRLRGAKLGTRMGGEGKLMQMSGFAAVIERIASNRPQFSSVDPPTT